MVPGLGCDAAAKGLGTDTVGKEATGTVGIVAATTTAAAVTGTAGLAMAVGLMAAGTAVDTVGTAVTTVGGGGARAVVGTEVSTTAACGIPVVVVADVVAMAVVATTTRFFFLGGTVPATSAARGAPAGLVAPAAPPDLRFLVPFFLAPVPFFLVVLNGAPARATAPGAIPVMVVANPPVVVNGKVPVGVGVVVVVVTKCCSIPATSMCKFLKAAK